MFVRCWLQLATAPSKPAQDLQLHTPGVGKTKAVLCYQSMTRLTCCTPAAQPGSSPANCAPCPQRRLLRLRGIAATHNLTGGTAPKGHFAEDQEVGNHDMSCRWGGTSGGHQSDLQLKAGAATSGVSGLSSVQPKIPPAVEVTPPSLALL